MKRSFLASEHKNQLEKLARRGTASVVGAAFSAVSGIVLVVIVTNGFPRSQAGVLFAGTAAFLILEAVVVLGTDTGLVRWLPGHLATGRLNDVRATLAVSLAPVVSFSVVAGGLFFLTAPLLSSVMVETGQEGAMTTVLRVLAVLLPVAATHHVLLAATRGMGTMRPTVVVENIGRLALQAVAVLAVYLVERDMLLLILAWSLPYVIALAWTVLWLRSLLRNSADVTADDAREWRVIMREFWAYTAPRAFARITQTALKRSDIVLVAALSSAGDAALYAAATRFVVFGQLLVQAVQQALAPHLSSLFARSEVGAARSVFQAATVWSMLPAWPIYILTAGFAPQLMTIFGEGYREAWPVVTIVSLTMLFATACGPVDSVLLMAGRSWLSLMNSTVALTTNLALNFVLIPADGVRGAAVAWSVAIIVRNLLPLVQVRKGLDMWPGTLAASYAATGSVVCFGLVAGGAQLAGLSVLTTALLITLGGGVYVAGVWLLRDVLGLNAFRTALYRRSRPPATRASAVG
jgi:O-antigen/teichoic acid export membrane protein